MIKLDKTHALISFSLTSLVIVLSLEIVFTLVILCTDKNETLIGNHFEPYYVKRYLFECKQAYHFLKKFNS